MTRVRERQNQVKKLLFSYIMNFTLVFLNIHIWINYRFLLDVSGIIVSSLSNIYLFKNFYQGVNIKTEHIDLISNFFYITNLILYFIIVCTSDNYS